MKATVNELTEEALEAAIGIMIDEVPARVLRIEHLLAIAIQTGRSKDRERIRMLCESSAIDEGLLMDICARHKLPVPRIGTTE